MIDLAATLEAYLEPPTPGVLMELDRDDAAAIPAELRAARKVVAAARGCPDLLGPGHFDAELVDATRAHLTLMLATYDQTVDQ
jgi:hypothetical protein